MLLPTPNQDLQGHLTWAQSPGDNESMGAMGIEKAKESEEWAPTRDWLQHLSLGLRTNKGGAFKCWRPQALLL